MTVGTLNEYDKKIREIFKNRIAISFIKKKKYITCYDKFYKRKTFGSHTTILILMKVGKSTIIFKLLAIFTNIISSYSYIHKYFSFKCLVQAPWLQAPIRSTLNSFIRTHMLYYDSRIYNQSVKYAPMYETVLKLVKKFTITQIYFEPTTKTFTFRVTS